MTRMLCVAAVLLALAASPDQANAEGALRLLPSFRSAIQARTKAIAAGIERPTFVGAASIAPRHGFPWMASIQLKGVLRTVGHFCGGVAVAPGWVLTAAHCVSVAQQPGGAAVAADPNGLQVVTRSNVLFAGGDERAVADVVLHDGYRITEKGVPQNDLALLRVEGEPNLVPLPLSTERQAAELLTQEGAKLRIFGWGTATFDPVGAISNNLLYAFVDVVDRKQCNASHVYAGAVDENMFCAGIGTADSCQGDSGGPVNAYADGRMVLVGIISWGVGCTQENYPGVYANVAKYEDWIRRTIGARD
jgi:secreted trypsin-like serine protease